MRPTRLRYVQDRPAKRLADDRRTRQPSQVSTPPPPVLESRQDRRRTLPESENSRQRRRKFAFAFPQTQGPSGWDRRTPRKPSPVLLPLRLLLPVEDELDRR